MRTALVLGVNGQDGSYIAESLLNRGYEVFGVGRNSISKYIYDHPKFHYLSLDLHNLDELIALLSAIDPNHIFHFAAIHGASGFEYESLWGSMWEVNVASLQCLLEYARQKAPQVRIVYAGSSKIFSQPHVGSIDEDSPTNATCLYGIGKIAARDLIFYYRSKHNVRATNLILFNHDSPRRRPEYFLPTIARAIAAAKTDRSSCMVVRTLNFRIDWGSAQEYADIAIDIAEKSDEAQFVLASGVTWHAREAIQYLFQLNGLHASSHIKETCGGDARSVPNFQVQIDRLMRAIGRRPRKTIEIIVREMLPEIS